MAWRSPTAVGLRERGRFASTPESREDMRYRADIDGLRAVAVIGVLLFHAGWLAPGGFVGVDVFFVISGFLITALIFRDLDAGSFSLMRFWQRRIGRIWPAALLTTAATLAAGWFVLLPDDYKMLAGDAIAQVCMLANVRYVTSSDYFAPTSDLRPLLHTWSLAVEEQFYVFFPLLGIVLSRFRHRTRVLAIGSLAAVSLVASEWATRHTPGEAFYLLPYRAWELLAGSLIAAGRPLEIRHRFWRESLGFLGLAAILVPMACYDRLTPFPGVGATLPCAGAAAMIVAGAGEGCAISRAMAIGPLRAVGQISYSLYLWHWPLLAFLRYVHGSALPPRTVAGALLLTVGISILSWRFIETPFRLGTSRWGFAKVFAGAGVASAAIVAAALGIRVTGGAKERFEPALASFASQPPMRIPRGERSDPAAPEDAFEPSGAARADTDRPCFLLWGDSHGIAIAETIDRLAAEAGVPGEAWLKSGTPPLPHVWRPLASRGEDSRRQAILLGDQMMEWIGRRKPRHVIVCARWSRYLEGGLDDAGEEFSIAGTDAPAGEIPTTETARRAFEAGLLELSDRCRSIDATLWFLHEVPLQPRTPHLRAVDAALSGRPLSYEGVDLDTHRRYTERVAASIASLGADRIRQVDLAAPFFDRDGRSQVGRDGRAWYRDDDHVNTAGAAETLGKVLTEMIEGIAADCAEARR